jgi:hypothetical protein
MNVGNTSGEIKILGASVREKRRELGCSLSKLQQFQLPQVVV